MLRDARDGARHVRLAIDHIALVHYDGREAGDAEAPGVGNALVGGSDTARVSSKPTVKPEPPPLPFRIVGTELRAGQRTVSIVINDGTYALDQVQVLLPGDAAGPWRLQAVDEKAAVFQFGDQTRRVALP